MGLASLQWTVYTVLLIVTAAISVISIYYTWRQRTAPWIHAGSAMLLAGAIWTAAYALELAHRNLETKILWSKVQYVGIAAIPVVWLVFTLQYTGHGKWLTRRNLVLLSLWPVVVLVLVWTNEFHHLMWRDMANRTVAYLGRAYVDLHKTAALGYVLFAVTFVASILFCAFLLIQVLARSRPVYRWQAIVLLAATFGLTANGIVEDWVDVYPDYLPLTYAASSLVIVWALAYLRKEDLVAVSHRLILESLVDPVLVLDAQNRILSLNAACRRLIDPFHARPPGHALGDVDQVWPAWAEHIGDWRDTNEVRQEIVFDQEQGRTYDVRVSPVLDWRNGLIGRVAAMRDITELKQTEQEKRVLQDQLLQARKLEIIGTLAGGIAHDFNNLLTAIQGNATLAKNSLDPDMPVYFDLQEIELACRRAARLTRQLLMFSRKEPVRATALCLNTVVNELIEMLERLIGEDIAIRTDLDPDLWTVVVDKGSIEQVIINLVVNARDAMPRGGKIAITTRNVNWESGSCPTAPEALPGQYACLSVVDTGIGMDEQVIQHIFEPFFSTKEAGKGTGLGLAVVYGVIRQHQGWIQAESQVGRGSTLSIYLPAVSGALAEELPSGSISLEGLEGKGERILLVEDEKSVREFAARVLGQHGYVVVDAPDVQTAMDILERENWQFDLVFGDVVLPDKSGLELAEQILARDASFHILLSSGYTGPRSRWETIRDRGFKFLQKPYTLTDLLGAVREAIE